MDLPSWFVISLTGFVMLLALGLGVAIDVLIGKPNLLVTAFTAIDVLVFSIGMFWLATRDRLLRRRRLAQVSTADKLWALTPLEMEEAATELFRLQDYVVTENKRPDLPEGGVDFEIFKGGETRLVQVKHWRQEVTVRETRELWGLVASEGAAGGVFIGTSGFTAYAREFAEGKDLRLIDGAEFIHLRSQLSEIQHVEGGESDPMVSEGFANYIRNLDRPTCSACQKPMVVVTLLRGTVINKQFWGCQGYPDCEGRTRRFAVPYLPAQGRR